MKLTLLLTVLSGSVTATACAGPPAAQLSENPPPIVATFSNTRYGTETIDGLDIFYREAGTPGDAQIVLLHGFPTSSHMFHDLIPMLAEDFHIIAPDYPGFGLSSAPAHTEYNYTFDNFAKVVNTLLERKGFNRYVLYVMDYGAPVGYRIASAHPERVRGFVVQNGNAYEEGLREFWEPIKAYWATGSKHSTAERDALRKLVTLEATKWQWLTGVQDPSRINPDNWLVVQPLLDRPGNEEIQMDLFYDYGSNPPLYPAWQAYFRSHRPPMLITWGKNDQIFPEEGAHPYLRDLPDAELYILETGHFALEEFGSFIGEKMTEFIQTTVADSSPEPIMTHRSGAWQAKKTTATGHYAIDRSRDGRRLTLSADFSTDRAPDLKVALSPRTALDATDETAFRDALVLGELRDVRGGAMFTIPNGARIEDYQSVVIYCEAYSVLWTAAPIDPR